MRIVFSDAAWEDYRWWQQKDRRTLLRINRLIEDITRNGREGIGKPEALRGELTGLWSRRITHEHRLVYALTETEVLVVGCRYHYGR